MIVLHRIYHNLLIAIIVSQFSDEALADLTGEKKSLSQKAELLTKKIQWLRRNETILTTLYNCCALQGVGGENLPGKILTSFFWCILSLITFDFFILHCDFIILIFYHLIFAT